MKVLVYGGGARENALVWKIKQSPLLKKLYLCKPNDGFSDLGEVIDAENYLSLAQKAKELEINLLVVGPEDPLAGGIVDEFLKVSIPAIGANKKWANLEGSKSFAKEFMERNNIPTANYSIITQKNQSEEILNGFEFPVVIKADGLAAGKGVYITQERGDALEVVESFLDGKYGEASKKILVEEFLEGAEISLIAIWDGKNLLPLVPARDYKRLMDKNKGPNTGGMGSYCPVSLTAEEYEQIEKYTVLLKDALIRDNADFTGIVYSGLMMTKQGIKVLEYNMRFGDPETQALLTHLESDLLELFKLASEKRLDEAKLQWKSGQSFCVVVAAQGYPDNPIKGGVIYNIDEAIAENGVNIFYAGVKKHNGSLLSNGGRVLSVCKNGITSQKDIYDAIDRIDFEDKIYRKDIGEVSLFGSSEKGCCKNEGSCNSCGI